MIEESGRVIALETGAVWVETLRKSTCSSCSANAGCGQGLMDKLGVARSRGLVRVLCDLHVQVGDSVVIGVREDLLVRGSLLVYLLPLLCLFTAAGLAQGLGWAEAWVIFSGLTGLGVGWLIVRWRTGRTAGDPALQPVVLRAMLVGTV